MIDRGQAKSIILQSLGWLLPTTCLVAAGGAATFGLWDLRADKVEAGLTRAEAASSSDGARSAAIAEIAELLADGRLTGRLHHQAARLALLERPQDYDRVRVETLAGLDRNPAQGDAWARLALVDLLETGRLSAEGQSALLNSFLTFPHGDLPFQHWRMEFALSLWHNLDDETRSVVGQALHGYGTPRSRSWLMELATRLRERRAEPDAIELVEQVLTASQD